MLFASPPPPPLPSLFAFSFLQLLFLFVVLSFSLSLFFPRSTSVSSTLVSVATRHPSANNARSPVSGAEMAKKKIKIKIRKNIAEPGVERFVRHGGYPMDRFRFDPRSFRGNVFNRFNGPWKMSKNEWKGNNVFRDSG